MNFDKRPKLRQQKRWCVYFKSDLTFDQDGLYKELCAMENPFRHWIDLEEETWKFVVRGWGGLIELVVLLQKYTENLTISDQDGNEVEYDLLLDEVKRAKP